MRNRHEDKVIGREIPPDKGPQGPRPRTLTSCARPNSADMRFETACTKEARKGVDRPIRHGRSLPSNPDSLDRRLTEYRFGEWVGNCAIDVVARKRPNKRLRSALVLLSATLLLTVSSLTALTEGTLMRRTGFFPIDWPLHMNACPPLEPICHSFDI